MTSANAPSTDEAGSAAQRERRNRILEATVAIASEGGFEAVQMREVAQRADVALGTLYRYFPSKIHLLVSALAMRFDEMVPALTARSIPGDTAAERVITVLKRASRGMQGDPHLTDALTRAFMFADKSVAEEIHVVGMHMTTMLTRAMLGDDYVAGVEPTRDQAAIARVISDVWLASLVDWVTGRASAAEVAEHIETAVHLVLRA